MKNLRKRKCEILNVTGSKNCKVVGNGYMKSSRTSTVSIEASIVPILSQNVIKNLSLSIFCSQTKNARYNLFCYQIIFVATQQRVLFFFEIHTLRHYPKVNKKLKNENFQLPSQCLSFLKVLLKDSINRKTLLLRCGDVEVNPGLKNNSGDEILVINTLNVRGLKEFLKLKRILNKCSGIMKTNKNVIFNFQETHLDENDRSKIDLMWRGEYSLSPGGSKSRGCLTHYDNSWEVLDEFKDPGGRFIVLTLKKNYGIFTIVNLYAPNVRNVEFFEVICKKVIETKDKYDSEVIITGDFNLVIDKNIDSLNRNQTPNEEIVRDFVRDSFSALSFVDCYWVKNPNGGFTWSRGSCMSRLDMIFATSSIIKNLTSVNIDWTFDKSDHALLECCFKFGTLRIRGPGLPRLDSDLLAKPEIIASLKVSYKKLF